ncbi:MAG: Ig-like domain-containing protein [Clostridia bacterium]|nr:Ig-like domain-containing protein [Clostridia bacterium]
MKRIKGISTVLAAVICALCLFAFTSSAADEGKWIKAWSTAATEIGVEGYDYITPMAQNVAVRTVITPTASGTKIRVKFSNAYGKEDLVIDRANIAVSDTSKSASGIDLTTKKYISFNGYPGVTIPAGEEIYSDEVPFNVTAGQDIAVSSFIREFTEVRTMGLTGGRTYMKAALEGSGTDLIESETFNIIYDIELDADTQWLYKLLDTFFGSIIGTGSLDVSVSGGAVQIVPIITDIDVLNPNDEAYSVVVIGDSTVANNYPAYLAEKINEKQITDVGVSSKGLIGNRLTGDGLGYGSLVYGESLVERMKKDTIGSDGKNSANVRYAIIKTGANDIIHPVCTNIKGEPQPTADEMIDEYIKVFDFCHENGIKVIVIGITPWKGYSGAEISAGPQYVRTAAEQQQDWEIALAVNKWLSETSLHDGYVDYTPVNGIPGVLTDSTDGLNPSKKLQREWAEIFPYSLIGVGDTTRVAGIGISETAATVYKGSSKALSAKVTPESANQTVIWSSSDPSVASVDANGKVTGRARGEAVITVTTADRSYNGKPLSVSCKVSVRVKPTAIKINGNEPTIYTTKTTKLSVTFTPSDTDYKTVKWTTSNSKVATVSSKGVVTATGKGTATVTATSTVDSKVKATFKITVKKKVQVQAVYLNYDERSRYIGQSFTLVPSVNPSKATFPEVTWKSSDKKIAKVDKNGKVTALKKGTVVITCTSVDNPKVSAACIVNVKVKTTGVKLPSKKLTIYTTQTKTLKAQVSPSNASSKSVSWSSSDKSVATVSKSGKITAKKPGTAIITVKTKSGGYKATCKVTVKKYVKLKSFKLNKTSVSIKDGKTYTLKPVFTPSKASVKDLTWKSSNKSVATVSSKGVIKGVNPGKCTITCKSKETGKTVKCTVTVKRVSVKKVLFAEKTYMVKDNGTLQLKAHISPTNATNQKLKWKSSKPEYAKVSSKGKVTGLKAGKTVTITATSVDGKKVATCKVKVVKVPVKSIKLNKTTASVYTGGSVTLTPKFSPSKPTNTKVTWTSSDTKLATVSADGVVKALRKGTVTITCTTDDGAKKASCTVVIEQGIRVTGVTLSRSEVEANVGTVFNLTATVEPYNASNKKLIWTSTNTSVATVSSNGKVTTLKEGLTYIQVRTDDGRKVDSCRINVVP